MLKRAWLDYANSKKKPPSFKNDQKKRPSKKTLLNNDLFPLPIQIPLSNLSIDPLIFNTPKPLKEDSKNSKLTFLN